VRKECFKRGMKVWVVREVRMKICAADMCRKKENTDLDEICAMNQTMMMMMMTMINY